MAFKEIKKAYDLIYKVKYSVSDEFGLSFITPERYDRIQNALSFLRKEQELNGHEYHVICSIFKHSATNYYKVKELTRQNPRLIAQRFIGRKKIRDFIFNRDKKKCLCCGSNKKLQIDHIIPVAKQGENKISNLQTLCASCNSRKSDKFKDYRNGSR